MPYFLALKAEALHLADRTIEALDAIREAQTLAETSEARWWYAELDRLRGVFRFASNLLCRLFDRIRRFARAVDKRLFRNRRRFYRANSSSHSQGLHVLRGFVDTRCVLLSNPLQSVIDAFVQRNPQAVAPLGVSHSNGHIPDLLLRRSV